MISYKPLFHTLVDKNKTITDLNRDLNMSPRTTAKFKRGESVTLETIVKICEYLDCRIEDVIEIIPDEDDE